MNTGKTLREYLTEHKNDYFADAHGRLWLGADYLADLELKDKRAAEMNAAGKRPMFGVKYKRMNHLIAGELHVIDKALYIRTGIAYLEPLEITLMGDDGESNLYPVPILKGG